MAWREPRWFIRLFAERADSEDRDNNLSCTSSFEFHGCGMGGRSGREDVVDKQDRAILAWEFGRRAETSLLLLPSLSRRAGGLFRSSATFDESLSAKRDAQASREFARDGFRRVLIV